MTVLQFHTFVATVVSRIEVLPCRWPSLPAGRTDAEKIRIVEESLQGYRHALLDEASSWVKVSRLCATLPSGGLRPDRGMPVSSRSAGILMNPAQTDAQTD